MVLLAFASNFKFTHIPQPPGGDKQLLRPGDAGNARPSAKAVDLEALLAPRVFANLDLFDRLQLEAAIAICRGARTLSDAGRKLFDQSREQRSVVNDADRRRKYLLKYGTSCDSIRQ